MLDKTFSFLESEEQFTKGMPNRHPHNLLFKEAVDEVRRLRSMPEIIMLAGSSRFKLAFEQEAERIALAGCIVLGKSVYKPGDQWNLPDHQKDIIHAVQFRMCDLSTRLHIINVDGYVGNDTYNVIRYAVRTDKVITFLEDRVRLLQKEGESVTVHHFLQATHQRVKFEEAAVGGS